MTHQMHEVCKENYLGTTECSCAAATATALDYRQLPRELECATGMKRTPACPAATCSSQPGAGPSRPSYAISEMNAQTSGCILQDRSRNRPRPSGIVTSEPRRFSRADTAAPIGCAPWIGC